MNNKAISILGLGVTVFLLIVAGVYALAAAQDANNGYTKGMDNGWMDQMHDSMMRNLNSNTVNEMNDMHEQMTKGLDLKTEEYADKMHEECLDSFNSTSGAGMMQPRSGAGVTSCV